MEYDEIEEILNYIDNYKRWEDLSNEERYNLLEDKWAEIKFEKNEKLRKINSSINIKLIYEALNMVSGYSKIEMEKLEKIFGDIGSVAEYVLMNKKQNKLRL